jgi:signal transduction histidine kinase
MRSRLTLRIRFLLATLVMVVLLCVTFALTVHRFIEILEDEMLHQTLAREMQDFARDFEANPDREPPSAGGLSGYIVRDGRSPRRLPPELARISPGLHEDIAIQGEQYYAARQDVPGARLYLLLDTEHVDAIERGVVAVAVLGAALALALAGLVATLLARAVMRPVTALANEVTALDPRRRNVRLRGRFADREVGMIAGAFDDYLARLDRVLEREQAFTEDASHELRTPLSIIASAAQLLSEEAQMSAQGRERIQRIRRACAQMQSLIEVLLFLAREDDPAPAQACALDEIVRETVEAMSPLAVEKNVGLDIQVEPVLVRAPPGMVTCVVNNLLLNAINFTQQGLIEVRLAGTELMVRDTGVGIAPAELSHIFERRYRGSQSRGLGLGLYLVHRICERLGWVIQADSAPGTGTCFRITLSSGADV